MFKINWVKQVVSYFLYILSLYKQMYFDWKCRTLHARGMRFDDYNKKDVCIDAISNFFLYFTNGVVIK